MLQQEDRQQTGSALRLAITSKPPEAEHGPIDEALLRLFRAALGNEAALPYTHQARVFEHVLAGREVALVAGTAAGKTLAMAVPLFHQVLNTGGSRKIVFIYPTRALLADQRRILHGLAACLGQQDTIGEVRGGMTSAALIRAVSKRIVLATPDALYWFFRKNVKFTMTLIYGLAQADTIVLDEAHLYTGLMQRNMQHFLQRLRHYRERYLGKPLRVQYLTATTSEALREFSPEAIEVTGRSLSTDVALELRPAPRLERSTGLQAALAEALERGGKRVLLVSNSARTAHQLFLSRVTELSAGQRTAVPDWFWEGFGLVRVGTALAELQALDSALATRVAGSIREELTIRARDLTNARAALRAEYLAELAGQPVERDAQRIRWVLSAIGASMVSRSTRAVWG